MSWKIPFVGSKNSGNSPSDGMLAGSEREPLSRGGSVVERYSPLSNKLTNDK